MGVKRSKAEKDPAILEKILTVLSVGAGRRCAAAQAGISHVTLRTYEAWGREAWGKREAASEAGKSVKLTPREELFCDFYERIQKAETNSKTYMLGLVSKAAKDDWKAASWLLTKLYPSDYGDRSSLRVDVGQSLAEMLEAVQPHMSASAWRELIEALATVEGAA